MSDMITFDKNSGRCLTPRPDVIRIVTDAGFGCKGCEKPLTVFTRLFQHAYFIRGRRRYDDIYCQRCADQMRRELEEEFVELY